jgi:threonine/homoserine/homoserine lactone efflux protein
MVLTLAAIFGALAAGVISPGPSFVMVARTAGAQSRTAGMQAALGMGLGGMMFAIAALVGLQAVFAAVPAAYFALKVLGGLYLAYLGYRLWKGASASVVDEESESPSGSRRAFVLGLVTQLSNPKTAIVYASVFAAFLPDDPTLGLTLVIPVVAFIVEAGWYGVVAFALSAAGPRAAYRRARGVVDRLAGALLTALGIRFVVGAFR